MTTHCKNHHSAETKSWTFQKINKIGKLLARLTKKKERGVKTNKIRNEKGEVISDITEIQMILRLQLYNHIMDNLEEMDKLLDMYNIPRLNQEEIKNMNRPITGNDTELVI